MMRASVTRGVCLAILIGLGACGEDEPPPPPPRPTAAAAAAAAGGAGSGSAGKPLVAQVMVEDNVMCPGAKEPDKKDKCDLKNPLPCPDPSLLPADKEELKKQKKNYCILADPEGTAKGVGTFCTACNERDTIRHVFKDRDFVGEQNRDPFQSFVLVPVGIGSGSKPALDASAPPKCNEYNSFALNHSYQDLKLVGIVTQGTTRKGLVTGGRQSYIIKRNDCIGKEKGLVKEVGDGYVTIISQPDPNAVDQQATEFSLPLNQNALALAPEQPPSDRPATTTTVPSPTKTAPAPKPEPAPTTRIQIPTPTPTPTPTPATPPTQLKP